MARLPRLVLPGYAHYVIQRGRDAPGTPAVFSDDRDRLTYLTALRQAAAGAAVQVHGYALLDTEVQLLATPTTTSALGQMMQALGRSYGAAYNRRHAQRGSLWDGRFRAAVVEPGESRLQVLRLVDGAGAPAGAGSISHRTGGSREPWLVDPPEFWSLGNTPFEREAAYRGVLAQGLPAPHVEQLRRWALGGWAIGTAEFLDTVQALVTRPARPRAPGRRAAV